MLAKVRLDTWSAAYKALDESAWREVAEALGMDGPKPNYLHDLIVELDLAAVACARHGLSLTVDSIPGSYAMRGTSIAAVRQRLEKLRDIDGPAAAITAAMKETMIVQVSIPDIGLLELDEVEVMEDACTDELRRRLNEGWRLIAVCPPNGQRRPDYVLGRSPRRRLAQMAPPPTSGFRHDP